MAALNLNTRSVNLGVLDSIGGSRLDVISNIRAYLYEENITVNKTDDFDVKLVNFEVPQQLNNYDCGVFIIAYSASLFNRYI